jgi:fermentation-respiration switch protein FrsA (DUF1100 family)
MYCSVLVALVITEVAVRPPWYKPSTPEQGLTKKQLPSYWQGICNNPKYDLGLDYEEVEFSASTGYTLRGWFVPASVASSDNSSNRDLRSPEIPPLVDEAVQNVVDDVDDDDDIDNGDVGDVDEIDGRQNVMSSSSSSSTRGRRPSISSIVMPGVPPADLAVDVHTSAALLSGKKIIPKRHEIGIVCVHGGGRDRRAFLRHVPLFHAEGYDVLLFDLSEHGVSDGHGLGFTFGLREKEDVKAAVKWMREVKRLPKVVLLGTSVGASSSIMAAAEDQTVDAVIAENPVACAEDFAIFHIKKLMENYAPNLTNSIWLRPFYTLIARTLLWRMGALFGYTRPYQLVDKISPRPILLMHGTCDDIVPFSHSQLLFERAKEPKQLWMAKDAWHCALYDQHPDLYRLKIHQFLDTHFHHREAGLKQNEVDITQKAQDGVEKEVVVSGCQMGMGGVNLENNDETAIERELNVSKGGKEE